MTDDSAPCYYQATMNKLLEKLQKQKPLIFDGAMGTILMELGYGNKVAELLNIENPQVIQKIHEDYVAAGADIIETNTFNGSYLKLKEHGLGDIFEKSNTAAVMIAKQAAGDKALVAGSMGPSGKLIEPTGDVLFDDIYDSYTRQARVLNDAGVDLFMIETISDIQEMKAGLLAVKDICDKPVICSMTYNDDGKTLTGTDMYTAAVTLSQLGADVISVNCSMGPEGVLELFKRYADKLSELNIPLMVMPNAGLPVIKDNQAIYTMTDEQFANIMDQFRDYGVNIYGGCCGTKPFHIKAVARKLKNKKITKQQNSNSEVYFTSISKVVKLSQTNPFLKVGEALNPTARKAFNEQLRAGSEQFLRDQARLQTQQGADLLDINVGIPELDQKELIKKTVRTLSRIIDTPLCIDSDDPAVIEEALKIYPGIAMINSVNGKKETLEKIVPLAKKYGANLIALTLDEQGIPEKAEDRFTIAQNIIKYLNDQNYDTNKVFFDGLVMTIASEPQAAIETIEITRMLKEHGLKSSLGVSNVSFGLPQRKLINNVFLDKLKEVGLSAAIISTATFQELSGYSPEEKLAEAVINGDDPGAKNYIANIGAQSAGSTPKKQMTEDASVEQMIYDKVIYGEEQGIVVDVERALENNSAQEIINNVLIKALDTVGKYYSEGKYYLPQMIASANAMKKAFNRLKKEFKKDEIEYQGTVVICTVEGDIHDIGKNIVAMMLENHGYQVIDLGKNVSSDQIVSAVKEHRADVVLLSALLTTTMLNMKEVKKSLLEEGIDIPVMLGGAVVTADYAENIGAHYSKDAADAIGVVKKILSGQKI